MCKQCTSVCKLYAYSHDAYYLDLFPGLLVVHSRDRELEVGTGLPRGSSASPILSIIYVSGVHMTGDGSGWVWSLSFIDDVTSVAQGRSAAEVRVKLEGAARKAISWGHSDGVGFGVSKTEGILFSRNRRHWRGRATEQVQVGPHFNRQATRWLGIYLDSCLRFTEHAARSSG